MKECPRCLLNESVAIIGEKQCNHCDKHDLTEKKFSLKKIENKIKQIKLFGINKKYDCLIGVSGSIDSLVMLYLIVKEFNLRPLVIHFNNHWDTKETIDNITTLISKLNVDTEIKMINREEYNKLNESFLSAGVPDAEIVDRYIVKSILFETAFKNKIKYIINSNDFRKKGFQSEVNFKNDFKYIQSVYKKFTNKKLKNIPKYSLQNSINYFISGIREVNLFNYNSENYKIKIENIYNELKQYIDFKDFSDNFSPNLYQEFLDFYLLPNKFNFDKRIFYISAEIRSKLLDKKIGKFLLDLKPTFNISYLGAYSRRIENLIESPIRSKDFFI